MNQAILKTDIDLQNIKSLNFNKADDFGKNVKTEERLYINFTSLAGKVLELIKSDLQPEILIRNFIEEIKKYIKLEGYLIFTKFKDENLLELNEGFNYEVKNYLFDGGLIQLTLKERKLLIIEYPIKINDDSTKYLLIIPYVFSENTFVVFCLVIENDQLDFGNSLFSLIELQFNFVGSFLINKFLNEKNKELKSNLLRLEQDINQELNYATAGKVCLKSFHNLKNRTQVIVSSFNLLNKLIDTKNDERLNKISEILNKEIPEFSKAIKLISEHSKSLITESKPIYFEFDKFILDIRNLFDATGLSNNFKFNFSKKLSSSKIFGYNQKLLQAFILLFYELQSNGIKEVSLENEEDEKRLRLKVNFKSTEENSIDLRSLLNEKSNLKFARIKNLFMKNSCVVITNSDGCQFEIVISIPKRSSQFKPENLRYAKDFDS